MTAEQYQVLTVVAARQCGLVTGQQAERVGIDRSRLADWVGAALLFELDYDVYQLTSSPLAPRFAYLYAVWLALDPASYAFERTDDAVVAHGSAARLLGLGAVSAPTATFIASRPPAQPLRAVQVLTEELAPEQVTTIGPLKVTVPHRTILDLVRSGTDHVELRGVLADAVRRDTVDLARLYADLVPLAERYEFPAEGPEFAGYFLPDLDSTALSPRNLRALTTVVLPDRVTESAAVLRGALAAIPGGDRVDERTARELAAEIVGRTERV